MHPRTRRVLADAGQLEAISRLARVVDPVSYLDMMVLEKHARLIATDSGGVQKEAFLHGVPCITLREQTEWTELVDLGWNRVAVPNDMAAIRRAVQDSLDSAPESAENPYGDGHAGDRIAATIVSLHQLRSANEAVDIGSMITSIRQ